MTSVFLIMRRKRGNISEKGKNIFEKGKNVL
jgi:hypothetical protein